MYTEVKIGGRGLTHWFYCGHCGESVNPGDMQCPCCGRRFFNLNKMKYINYSLKKDVKYE